MNDELKRSVAICFSNLDKHKESLVLIESLPNQDEQPSLTDVYYALSLMMNKEVNEGMERLDLIQDAEKDGLIMTMVDVLRMYAHYTMGEKHEYKTLLYNIEMTLEMDCWNMMEYAEVTHLYTRILKAMKLYDRAAELLEQLLVKIDKEEEIDLEGCREETERLLANIHH